MSAVYKNQVWFLLESFWTPNPSSQQVLRKKYSFNKLPNPKLNHLLLQVTKLEHHDKVDQVVVYQGL